MQTPIKPSKRCFGYSGLLILGIFVIMNLTASAQNSTLDPETRAKIAEIKAARKTEIANANDSLREIRLASGQEAGMREVNAIRLDQPELEFLLDLGGRVVSETPEDWETIHNVLYCICSHPTDDRIVTLCRRVLELRMDLASPSTELRKAVYLAIGILAQQSSPEALTTLRQCALLPVAAPGTNLVLRTPDGSPLSIETADRYARMTINLVIQFVDSDKVLSFIQDVATSIEPSSEYGEWIAQYMEAANLIDQGFEPWKTVE